MKILHISDIHMKTTCNKPFSDMLMEAISSSTEKHIDLSPDILLVTGDFTNTGLPNEFECAKKELHNIIKNVPSIKDCLIVPGNHDFSWEEGGKTVDPSGKTTNYRNFTIACEKYHICKSYPNNLPKQLKDGLEECLISYSFTKHNDYALLIIGMNSVVLDSSERAGQGFFGKRQHTVVQKLIKYYNRECAARNTPLIITAAFHHHILPVSSIERDTITNPDKFSLTLDARRTLDFFMENNVRMAFHGHQHQPSIVCWKDEMKKTGDSVYVISAGSMTQNKEDLGDISRNSFMIYNIEQTRVKVYCFQNKENDWDEMELSHDPYILSIRDPYGDIQCNIEENANPPKDIIKLEFSPDEDVSDLHYLFLNVVDCDQAREKITEFHKKFCEDEHKVSLCGLHHLYGKYDILIKYRSDVGDMFSNKLQEYLMSHKIILGGSVPYFMNVSYENQSFKQITNIPLLKNPEAYLNSTWNMATLTVYLSRKLRPKTFLNKLENEIKIFNNKYNTRIEDIIRNYSIGQDQSVIFELFISCYQFPMLTRFTNIIEDIIREYSLDKSTHIIYYLDERCI